MHQDIWIVTVVDLFELDPSYWMRVSRNQVTSADWRLASLGSCINMAILASTIRRIHYSSNTDKFASLDKHLLLDGRLSKKSIQPISHVEEFQSSAILTGFTFYAQLNFALTFFLFERSETATSLYPCARALTAYNRLVTIIENKRFLSHKEMGRSDKNEVDVFIITAKHPVVC